MESVLVLFSFVHLCGAHGHLHGAGIAVDTGHFHVFGLVGFWFAHGVLRFRDTGWWTERGLDLGVASVRGPEPVLGVRDDPSGLG